MTCHITSWGFVRYTAASQKGTSKKRANTSNKSKKPKNSYKYLKSKNFENAEIEDLLNLEQSGYLSKKLRAKVKSKANDSILDGSKFEPFIDVTDFDFNKCPYMSSLEQIELIKIIEKFKIVPIPPPPVLSRSFASDIIDQNEIWCKNYGWDKYKEYECLDRADSIS